MSNALKLPTSMTTRGGDSVKFECQDGPLPTTFLHITLYWNFGPLKLLLSISCKNTWVWVPFNYQTALPSRKKLNKHTQYIFLVPTFHVMTSVPGSRDSLRTPSGLPLGPDKQNQIIITILRPIIQTSGLLWCSIPEVVSTQIHSLHRSFEKLSTFRSRLK